MEKILILTDFYYPQPTANGICIHQIALALREKGHEVHVLSFNINKELKCETYEGIFVHRINPRIFHRLRNYGAENTGKISGKIVEKIAMTIHKVNQLMYAPFYPLSSIFFALRNNRHANRLHKKYSFDKVVTSYNPLEACVSGLYLKRKNPELTWIMYVLDSLTNGVDSKYLSRKFVESKGWKWEQLFYKYADSVLNLKVHENHHNKTRYDKYRHKMRSIDIPLLKRNEINITRKNYKDHKKTFVYTGTLALDYRSPEYLCELFIHINKKNEYILNFYSAGSAEGMLKKYQDLTRGQIIRHGYVNHKESIDAIYNSDILISIGNENSDMLPSKTLEYISTGKKIIHFYKNEKDSSLPYYEKYPLALLVNEKNNLEDNKKMVIDFINKPHKDIDFNKISNIFMENTPEYSAEIIEKI